ncbi:MAG TPA: PhoU family transcriptional regulator [Thermoplasmata archaeon]|nr:PhoU family transcriptional regulator [Thermoplasmata archaeon]
MSEKNIEDLLLEIKDTSELMVDLAYSSLLYGNRRIAEEVYDLENHVDNLHQTLHRRTLEEVQRKEMKVDDALIIIRLADSGEMIADAAQEIADVELRDVELHPVIKESVRESDTVFTRVKIFPQSILCGKTLGELRLASETGMTVIAIKRNSRWKYGPNRNTKIVAGDELFARGHVDGERRLIDLASGHSKEL